MSEPHQWVEPDEKVECCYSCLHFIEYYGSEYGCNHKSNKYLREVLGKRQYHQKMTHPHYKCKYYECDKGLF